MNEQVAAVIPTYNYGRFVARAVESVLAQTYPSVECIVVDDGSTDDTQEVLRQFGGRIRVVRQENSGLSAARNRGIGESKAGYVALLDADDWWEPEKITLQMEIVAERPEVAAVGCGVRLYSRDMEVIGIRETAPIHKDPGENLRAFALRKAWINGSGSGALVRRDVFDRVGMFDTDLKAAEDWDMWLRIAAVYPVANRSEILTNLQNHGTGVFRNAARMETNQWKVYRSAIERWPQELDPGIRRQMRAMILADAAVEYLGGGQKGSAVRRALCALLAWPLSRQYWACAAGISRKAILNPRN